MGLDAVRKVLRSAEPDCAAYDKVYSGDVKSRNNADTGDIADIIAGTFFICDCSGESFGSLSKEQQKRYLEKYRLPERFFRSRDGIESVPYKPQNRER